MRIMPSPAGERNKPGDRFTGGVSFPRFLRGRRFTPPNSTIIPNFGSLDLLTGWLANGTPNIWFYYSPMSTAGSCLGALLTYRMGQRLETE
jgi:hypothetical protein